jgi:mediator of RNA polymerase II transcription subunit 31
MRGLLCEFYSHFFSFWKRLTEEIGSDRYPHCLHYLELLQHEQFRKELKNPTTRMRLEHYQFEHWRTW